MNDNQFLINLDKNEAYVIDVIVKLVVWLTPLFTGLLIYFALTDSNGLNMLWYVALIGSIVIELAGLAFMHTTMSYFYQWKGIQSAKVNFTITLSCVFVYVIIALFITLVIKLPSSIVLYTPIQNVASIQNVTSSPITLADVGKILIPPLAVILSMSSALVGSVRASHYKQQIISSTLGKKRYAKLGNYSNFAQKGREKRQSKIAERKNQTLQLWQNGKKDLDELAEIVGVTKRTVKSYLQEMGITL